MNIDLTGKIALVTGGTGELGRVMVRTLANCGAQVAIHYLSNRTKAEELHKEIQAEGGTAIIVQADITKEASIFEMKEQIKTELGEVDIVVANAVVQYAWTTILEQSPEDYQAQFDSCVMQSVYLAKAFIPAMQRKQAGRFIGINTECSMQSFPTQSAYVAGKRGMDGVYRVLAKEVGEFQITVNQVAPGWTISEKDRSDEAGLDEAYIFLASDLASFITGAYLPVTGGNVMPAI